jgi:hypothetical protein
MAMAVKSSGYFAELVTTFAITPLASNKINYQLDGKRGV